MGLLGVLVGLALLVFFAFRGWSVLLLDTSAPSVTTTIARPGESSLARCEAASTIASYRAVPLLLSTLRPPSEVRASDGGAENRPSPKAEWPNATIPTWSCGPAEPTNVRAALRALAKGRPSMDCERSSARTIAFWPPRFTAL